MTDNLTDYMKFFVCPGTERNKVPVASIPLNYDYYVRTIYRDDILSGFYCMLTQLSSINPGWYDLSVSNLDTYISRILENWNIYQQMNMKFDQQSSIFLTIFFV